MSTRLLFTLIVVATTVTIEAQFDKTTCGTEKGCMFSPTDCDPMANCYNAFSWKVIDNTFLHMELTGISSNGDINYIAVGFSSDQKMGNTPVTDCTFDSARSTAMHLSFNADTGRSNTRITDYPYLSSHLQLMSTNASNGRLYCAVRQLIVPQQSNSRIPVLNGSKFFILMAVGTASDQGLNAHSHVIDSPSHPFVASHSVNLTNEAEYGTQVTAGGLSPVVIKRLIKAHGIMMITAWFIFISTAIMFARYFRGHWPDSRPMGLRVWFHFHRTINTIAVVLIIAAFVCIFTAKGWEWMGPGGVVNTEWGTVHSMVGLLAVVLAWTQPIMAIFRCGPTKPLRPIFNWLHRFAGLVGWLLAGTAITIASKHFTTVGFNTSTASGLVIAYLVSIGVVVVVHEVITIRDKIKGGSSSRINVSEMKADGKASELPIPSDTLSFPVNSKTKLARLVLLGLFVIIGWSLAIALIVVVALS